MKFITPLIFLACFTCFASSYSNCISDANHSAVLSRPRRYLDFMKSTRMFFRANIKENVFTWGSIWAHAVGFKANMNILNENKRLRPYRRDTYEVLQHLLNLHGFNGQACLLKAFCIATRAPDGQMSNGMLFKLLRHIFKLDERDRNHFAFLKDDNCDLVLHHECPLSFNSISPFTDDV